MYIVLAIFIFGFLIFIHELGHFVVARLCGVKILEFAIGMGPKVLSHVSKKSGIRYSLRLLPLGGYVSMLGENGMETVQGDNGESEEETPPTPLVAPEDEAWEKKNSRDTEAIGDPAAYCNQSVWKRMLISIAGPFMNVLLGFVMMAILVLSSGGLLGSTEVAAFYVEYNAENAHYGLEKGDYIQKIDGKSVRSFADFQKALAENTSGVYTVSVQRLTADGTDITELEFTDVPLSSTELTMFRPSLSEQSGLCVGDVIKEVNSVNVHTYNELGYEIMNQGGVGSLTLTVERNGETLKLNNVLVPTFVDSGAAFGDVDFRVYAEENSFGNILKHTWFRSLSTIKMVYDSIFGLASGKYGVEAVSGPVGITKTISDVAKTGWMNILYLVTVISVNLGIMNLLPLPALDGGHILLYVIELIRGKPMKKEVEAMINFLGLVLLLGLAVVISIKDIIAL